MKSWIIRMFLLVGYCIPYVFLSMNYDVITGTMQFYGVMIVCFALLCLFSIITVNIKILVIGNVLSFISSYLFMLQNQTEKWGWYFKPLTANMLLIIISVIILLIQLVFVFSYNVKQRK